MTDKLNQSLDEILKDRRQSARRPRGRRAVNGGKPSTAAPAPVGGVRKTTRATKVVGKTITPTGPSGSGDSKIIVSNLVSRSRGVDSYAFDKPLTLSSQRMSMSHRLRYVDRVARLPWSFVAFLLSPEVDLMNMVSTHAAGGYLPFLCALCAPHSA